MTDPVRAKLPSRLHHAQVLGRQLKIPHLHLQTETLGPTGSAKDRIAPLHVAAAKRAGLSGVTAASTGSYGVALANAAKQMALRCVVFMSSDHAGRRIDEMERAGATVERVDGDFVDTVQESRDRARKEGWYDANAGAARLDENARAYAVIAAEIVAGLGGAPGTVAAPTRDGTLLVGLHRGFEDLLPGAKIRTMPRLIAASTKRGNPIVWSLARGDATSVDMERKDVWPHATSEALSTAHALDGTAAIQAVRASQGWGYAASDTELESLAKQLLRTERLMASPASLAGVAALHFAAKFGRLDGTGANVAVLTAKP